VRRTLELPIPAGVYKVFLRTRGPIMPMGESIARVTVGNTVVDFKWTTAPQNGKRFGWSPGVDLKLNKSATALALSAVQFGGVAYGTLYNPMRPMICVDTIYITDDLTQTVPPDLESERLIRAGMAAATLSERTSWESDAVSVYNPVTPRPVAEPVTDPVALKSFDDRANLWPNASFELGMNDGWAASTAGAKKYVFADADLDTTNPFHGTRSLRVPAGVAPFSRAYHLDRGGTATFSLYVRGEDGNVVVELKRITATARKFGRPYHPEATVALTMNAAATAEWQRLTASGDLESGWYYLSLRCTKDTWIDAVQFERGSQTTEFRPRAELETAVRSGQFANIIYEQDQKTLDVWFHNSGVTPKQARASYRITDYREAVVAEGTTTPVTVAPGVTVKKSLPILPGRRGIFSVTYNVAGRSGTEGETVYVVMPKPARERTRHELGGNISFSGPELAVHARLGLKWMLTCKSRTICAASEGVHTEPGKWNLRSDLAAMPAKYGLDLIPNFWPTRLPEFMQAPPPQGVQRTLRRQVRKFVPDLKQWEEHVAKLAAHYREHVKIWCFEDEMEYGGWNPAHILPVLQTTSRAVRKAAPDVKLGLSGTPEYVEELLALGFDPADFDYFGGSYHDFQYWPATKVRYMQERYGKPTISYGVGGRPPIHTMVHSGYSYHAVRAKIGHMARQIVDYCIVQDIAIPGHYAAILRNDGIHTSLNKPLCDYDGTPLPWGATFGVIGTLLADAEHVADIPLGRTGRLAYVFRIGDQLAAVTWAIMKPECSPCRWPRKAGRPERSGFRIRSMRRSAMFPRVARAADEASIASARGWPWKFPQERIRPLSGNTRGLSVTDVSSRRITDSA